VAAEEGRNMVSEAENILKSILISQVPILGPLNMIYGLAESFFHLGTQNTTYNTEL